MVKTCASTAKVIGDPFAHMDATEQARLVRDGDVTALELVDAAMARIDHLNPRINALASSNFDVARERARSLPTDGVFAGVPTLIKDLLAYPGHAMRFGSRLFKGMPAPGGSDYTEALDASGLVVLGKSATSEFGLLGTTETLANGATSNPWNLALSPGGSSGGAVAAVASGMVPIAHASDGGGSIRGPSSFSGLFGFKPSRGRTVFNGMPADMPLAGLISDHCISRSVRDSAAWLKVTERRNALEGLPSIDDMAHGEINRLRIGVYRDDCFGLAPEPDALCGLDAAIKLCEELGHDVALIETPPIDGEATSDAFFAFTGITLGGMFDQFKTMMGDRFDEELFEPYTRETVRRGRMLPPEAYQSASAALATAEAVANRTMSSYDAILSPTVPFAAFPLGQYGPTEDPDKLNAFTKRLAGYTFIASLAGWPAMSVPLHWTKNGLPIGSHFAAAVGKDALLLSLAFQLEEAMPWRQHLNDLAVKLACHSG